MRMLLKLRNIDMIEIRLMDVYWKLLLLILISNRLVKPIHWIRKSGVNHLDGSLLAWQWHKISWAFKLKCITNSKIVWRNTLPIAGIQYLFAVETQHKYQKRIQTEPIWGNLVMPLVSHIIINLIQSHKLIRLASVSPLNDTWTATAWSIIS